MTDHTQAGKAGRLLQLPTEPTLLTLLDGWDAISAKAVAGVPGTTALARLEELGVARVSYGPMSQRVALTALQEAVEEVRRGGGLPPACAPSTDGSLSAGVSRTSRSTTNAMNTGDPGLLGLWRASGL